MPSLGPTELLIILAIILVLFGYKKLPDGARALGRSLRIFKTEVREMKSDASLDEPDHLAGSHHAGATGDGQHGGTGGQREQHEVAHPQSR
jgi:sec-independent protein translocase protein TatA